MRQALARVVAPLCLIAVTTSACSHEPTRRQVITSLDSTCRSAQRRLSRIHVPPVQSSNDLRGFASAMHTALPIVIGELDDLGAIDVPKADQKRTDRILSEFERAVDQFNRAEHAARRGDLGATQADITRAQRFTKTADKLARDYGFRVCGRPT